MGSTREKIKGGKEEREERFDELTTEVRKRPIWVDGRTCR